MIELADLDLPAGLESVSRWIWAVVLIPVRGYSHWEKPSSIDAGVYGFSANIYFYDIETPGCPRNSDTNVVVMQSTEESPTTLTIPGIDE